MLHVRTSSYITERSPWRITPTWSGLVGTGVGPSLTPALHMAEAEAQGLRLRVPDHRPQRGWRRARPIGEVLDWARALGFDALNITHPCKRLVIEHLDGVDDVAAGLGAVNTVVFDGPRAVGYNTDTTGFAPRFGEGLPGAATDNVVLLGAGGAGAAVGDALLRLGADHLTIVDVDVERATALANDLPSGAPRPASTRSSPDKLPVLLPASDGVVHCTPTGMADHPGLPLDPDLLHPGLWVADIVYRPLDTALLGAALRGGLPRLRRRPHGRAPGHRGLRLDHRHHPRRRTHVPHFRRLVG